MSDLRWPASRLVGRAGVRGHLELTDTHIRFKPTGLAARIEGTPFAVQLKHLAAAGVAEQTAGLLRQRRERLCLTLGDGSEQLFDLPRANDVAAVIRERLAGRR